MGCIDLSYMFHLFYNEQDSSRYHFYVTNMHVNICNVQTVIMQSIHADYYKAQPMHYRNWPVRCTITIIGHDEIYVNVTKIFIQQYSNDTLLQLCE